MVYIIRVKIKKGHKKIIYIQDTLNGLKQIL